MNLTLDLYPACPSEFGMFLNYARGLAFDEKPAYDYLQSLFCKLLIYEGHQYGHPFAKCILSNNLCDQAIGGRGKTRRKALQENNVPHFSDKVYIHSSFWARSLITTCLRLRS